MAVKNKTEKNAGPNAAITTNENAIHIERVYDAPVNLVWEAWTDPKQVAKWWGPRGFTITTKSKDLRPGGTWVYTMHGPDGTDYPNHTTYHEVEQHKKLVYDHGASDKNSAPMFRVTVLFTDLKGKTKMDMTMALPSAEALQETRKIIKNHGGNSTWDRLAEYLSEKTSGQEIFVINRTFEAPADVVFAAWTEPKKIAQWLPPTGFSMTFIRADIKPGGRSFYFMADGSGNKMYGRAEYLEIEKPKRLTYTQQFCDENEKEARHPAIPNLPPTFLTTVIFSKEGPGKTRVTITWRVHGAVNRAEVEAFVKMRGGFAQGWTGSLDKLEQMVREV